MNGRTDESKDGQEEELMRRRVDGSPEVKRGERSNEQGLEDRMGGQVGRGTDEQR